MTLQEIREQVMFQTANDADDLPDFAPHLDDYINEGYDIALLTLYKVHVDYTTVNEGDPIPDYAALTNDNDVPDLPAWLHRALVDYATWLVYRNGNPQRQQRGMAYLDAFNKALGRASRLTAEDMANIGNGDGEVFRHHLDP